MFYVRQKNLSKIKHIYRIYEDLDGVLHCVKLPVIYINSETVYFKVGRKQEILNCSRLEYVHDDFVEYKKEGIRIFSKYFWNLETDVQEIFKDLKRQKEDFYKNNIIKYKKDQLEKSKRDYEQVLKDFETVLKDFEVYENKENNYD